MKYATLGLIATCFILFVVLMLVQAFMPPNGAIIALAIVFLIASCVTFACADEITRFMENIND